MPHLPVQFDLCICMHLIDNIPELDRQRKQLAMADHKKMCDSFLTLAKRRSATHGKWVPASFFLNTVQREFPKIDHGKLRKALEVCGMHMMKTEDERFGFLHVESTTKKTSVGRRWFICVASEKNPDVDSKTGDPLCFQDVLQRCWDKHNREATTAQDETTSVTNPEQQSPSHSSPPQQTGTMTPTARTVAPTADSPQLTSDEDVDSLEFFRSTLSPEHLTKVDLFRPEVINRHGALRNKIVAFGKSLAADSLVKHCEEFCQPTEPVKHTAKDVADVEKCPFLTEKHNIPWSVPATTEVATATFNLASDVPEVLQLQKRGGSKGAGKRLVAMTPSSDKKRLCCDARQWMEDIVDVAMTTDETSTFDIIKVLLWVLNNMDPLAFTHVAAEIPGSTFEKHKLDPELQQAMKCKANLNVSQLRIIKQFLCCSNLDMLQPESVMRRLEVDDFVRPNPIEHREGKGKRRKVSWHMPLEPLLTFAANKALEAKAFNCANLDMAHVILVGDHGQGAFRMMVTLLLITRKERRRQMNWRRNNRAANKCVGTELALEIDGQCGHMQCQKDACQVLKDTIATPISDDLLETVRKKKVTAHKDALDENKVKLCFGNAHTQNVVLASADAEMFMVGDLAFCSMALGKEGMAPHWCWRCPLSKAEWTESAEANRPDWSLESLDAHWMKLQNGELNTSKPEQVRGVKEQALFPVPPENVPVPSLHNNELFINHPLAEGLMRWIHHRIEQLPLELIDARQEKIDLLIKEEIAIEDLAIATAPIAALKNEVSSLRPTKVRNQDMYLFRDDEHEADCAAAVASYEEAKELQAECQKELREVKKNLKEAKKEVIKIAKKKEHGALSQVVRQQIEDHLQTACRTLRSSYHGGDFEGNHCRKFIREADAVMNDIEALLLGIPEVDRAPGCNNEEIQKHCRGCKRLFQHFDALIHCCHQPFGTLEDNDIVDVRRLVNIMDRLWRRLLPTVPPKAYAWQHLVVDLDRFRGLKHHSESKIEVSQQVGRRVDLMFRSVNDLDKKIESSLRCQHTLAKPSTLQIQQQVKASRSRKRTAVALNQEDGDGDRHGQMMALLNLPEIVDDFPSLDALVIADRKEEIEADVNNNGDLEEPVSYTHLTLPTNREV